MPEFTRYHRNNGTWKQITNTDNKGIEEKPRILTLVPKSEVTHKAVSSGNWNDSGIWDNGVPGDDARVHIPEGTTVTLTHQDNSRIKTLRVDGTFKVDPSVNTRLRVDTIVSTSGSRFEIGTDSNPVQSTVTAEIEFIDNGPVTRSDNDPYMISRGLITMGDVEIVGSEKSAWHTLSQNPRSGDTSFELSSQPTNWQVGDQLVTPGLEAYQSSSLDHRDEERTISSLSGSTVNFSTSLDYDHIPPESDLDTYVLNLTRNVRFYSENGDLQHRGHFMVMEPDATIKYAQFRDMGRTDKSRDATTPLWYRGEPESQSPENPRARYSMHFHHTGPTEPAHKVRGCVVWDNPGWGYVNHDSNVEVEDCISYKVLGSGFNAEKGTEAGHFKRNFALRSEGSGEQTESRKGWANGFANLLIDPPHNIDDFGHSGHGFWIHSPIVEVENNVMAGHRHTPITFWNRCLHEQPLKGDNPGPNGTESLDGKHDMFPKLKKSLLTDYEKEFGRPGDEDPPVGNSWHEKDSSVYFTDSMPLRSFKNNVAFGCGGGFDLSRIGFRNEQPRHKWYEHSDNTIYNVAPLIKDDGSKHLREDFKSSGNVGLDHRYIGNSVARNYRILGNGDGIGVYYNFSYQKDFHLFNCEIKDWDIGMRPPAYKFDKCIVKDTDFSGNGVDIEIDSRLGRVSKLEFKNNSYSGGQPSLRWPAAVPPVMGNWKIFDHQSSVRFEGRTVYHGWSRPDFVLVKEGDTERLDKIVRNVDWSGPLNGDDPKKVLPGATHRQLYEDPDLGPNAPYGITFYGGFADPSQTGFKKPAGFTGGGGEYSPDPFLGPKPADKTMPTNEIWIDAANKMSFRNDYKIVRYSDGDSIQNHEPLQIVNDQKAVQLDSPGERDNEPPFDETGIASYNFELNKGGTYQVHIRVQQGKDSETPVGGHGTSRVHIRTDGGEWKLHDGNSGLAGTHEFSWRNDRNGWWQEFDLSSGQHKIEIAGSGWGIRLDKVLIKHETCPANPTFKGKPHTQ